MEITGNQPLRGNKIMSETLQDKFKDGIDNTAGAGSADKAEGKLNEVIGQGKQSLGDALDNNKMKAEGATQELQGKVQQVGGVVQEKTQDVRETVTGEPESLIEKIKEGVSHVIDKVKDAIDGDNHTSRSQ
jgi:uncharacterized protein YjbJ (UPF0337 family)